MDRINNTLTTSLKPVSNNSQITRQITVSEETPLFHTLRQKDDPNSTSLCSLPDLLNALKGGDKVLASNLFVRNLHLLTEPITVRGLDITETCTIPSHITLEDCTASGNGITVTISSGEISSKTKGTIIIAKSDYDKNDQKENMTNSPIPKRVYAWACGNGVVAYASGNNAIAIAWDFGSVAYAISRGAVALSDYNNLLSFCRVPSVARATAEGAIARAINNLTICYADVSGAIAEAYMVGSIAIANAKGAVARADRNPGSSAYSVVAGAIAEAIVKDSFAFALVDGAVANGIIKRSPSRHDYGILEARLLPISYTALELNTFNERGFNTEQINACLTILHLAAVCKDSIEFIDTYNDRLDNTAKEFFGLTNLDEQKFIYETAALNIQSRASAYYILLCSAARLPSNVNLSQLLVTDNLDNAKITIGNLLVNNLELFTTPVTLYGVSITETCTIPAHITLKNCTAMGNGVTVRISTGDIEAQTAGTTVIAEGVLNELQSDKKSPIVVAIAAKKGAIARAFGYGAQAIAKRANTCAYAESAGATAISDYSPILDYALNGKKPPSSQKGLKFPVTEIDQYPSLRSTTEMKAIAIANAANTIAIASGNASVAYAIQANTIAEARAKYAKAYAVVEYSKAVAAGGEQTGAWALAANSVADAMIAGSYAYAMSTGAVANAMIADSYAYAMSTGAIANAMIAGSSAQAEFFGAIANAMIAGSSAQAEFFGAIANAMVVNSEALATVAGAVANQMVLGALAQGSVEGAVVQHIFNLMDDQEIRHLHERLTDNNSNIALRIAPTVQEFIYNVLQRFTSDTYKSIYTTMEGKQIDVSHQPNCQFQKGVTAFTINNPMFFDGTNINEDERQRYQIGTLYKVSEQTGKWSVEMEREVTGALPDDPTIKLEIEEVYSDEFKILPIADEQKHKIETLRRGIVNRMESTAVLPVELDGVNYFMSKERYDNLTLLPGDISDVITNGMLRPNELRYDRLLIMNVFLALQLRDEEMFIDAMSKTILGLVSKLQSARMGFLETFTHLYVTGSFPSEGLKLTYAHLLLQCGQIH